jgi:RNA polymerase sigma-B factor
VIPTRAKTRHAAPAAARRTGGLPAAASRASPPAPANPPPAAIPGPGADDEYQHLEPLLSRYAAMTADNPDRSDLRDQLVAGYLPIARHIARRYAQRGEPLDDLVQVASIGLLNAIHRFEPEHGRGFLAFAVPTITGEVRRHFRDKTWSMRVPRRLKDLHLLINKVVSELTAQHDRAPRPSEIAARLNVSTDEVLDALEAAQSYRANSLDEMLTAEANTATFGDLLGEPDNDFDKFINLHSLAPHLAALSSRERNILLMRFYGDLTQSQIAQRIGISQMHVSRLLAATLTRLRDALDQPANGAS